MANLIGRLGLSLHLCDYDYSIKILQEKTEMQVVKQATKRVIPSLVHPSHTWPFSMNDLVMPPVNIRWISFYENDGSTDFMDPSMKTAK